MLKIRLLRLVAYGRERLSRLSSQTKRKRIDRAISDFYLDLWRKSAGELSAEFTILRENFCEIRLGSQVTRIWQNYMMLDSPATLKIAGNKPLVHLLLSREGLPIPRYAEFTLGSLEKAFEFLEREGKPCVVKPASGTGGGAGVTTQVKTRSELIRASVYASLFCPNLMIEEQVEGEIHRLLYLDGELIDAVRCHSPKVTGDGRSTIRELIDAENKRRVETGSKFAQTFLTADLDCRSMLESIGLNLKSVPAPGESIPVKKTSNENAETENEAVLHLIGEDLKEEGRRAAKALGIRLAGVDVITRDPSVSLKKSGGAINEVNTTPGLQFHYQVRNPDRINRVALPILRTLLEQSVRS
jgi:cyanophycin synthetase